MVVAVAVTARCEIDENATPRKRAPTCLLDKFCWKLLDHAPIARLSPKLKQHSDGQRFSKDQEGKETVTRFIGGLEEGFQKWITRQEKCVQKSGGYIEKWFKAQAFRCTPMSGRARKNRGFTEIHKRRKRRKTNRQSKASKTMEREYRIAMGVFINTGVKEASQSIGQWSVTVLRSRANI
ncbi:hypothetical protein GWI33_023208 [Rhynchophorus ferrugineus]|uniref:Uncharacterized protein n=1 Tax=Rhynchophorus ferrugineus TaxID=354439 RepID=A0A834LY21_RHYFE|nr:hypothetical protein GWI33_023210 [Rhynchophorus ferrugineus]KAF7264446.1 hypothetical protein GWI33_023208 [Rhynchophorus ferrugineus]